MWVKKMGEERGGEGRGRGSKGKGREKGAAWGDGGRKMVVG